MFHWPSTFKVQSNSQELKQATVRILNFASSQEGTESRKLISPAIQPQQSSFSGSTYESGHISGKLDYNTWALPEKSQCCSSLIITLTCPGSSVTTSFLHTAHLHALGFSRSAPGSISIHRASQDQVVLDNYLKLQMEYGPLSVHLNRNDLMSEVSHCLKIAGSLNWKKPEHRFVKLQIELALLRVLIDHFFGEANEQLWEKKHHLRRKCLLDIHLSHIWGTMAVKNGNQDGFTNQAQVTSIPLDWEF